MIKVVLRRLSPLAAIRIQQAYRYAKWRRIKAKWSYLTFHLSRVLLPKIKRFLNNIFYSIMKRKMKSAVIIQSLILSYLYRVRRKKAIGIYCFFEGILFFIECGVFSYLRLFH